MTDANDRHLSFWGKARPPAGRPGPGWHPATYHLLDVAAVMEAILLVRPVALRRASRLLRLGKDETCRLLVALAALHDIGKFAPAFQAQVPDLWPVALGERESTLVLPGHHTDDGHTLWIEELAESVGERIWDGAGRVLAILAPAIFGHHGRPVGTRGRPLRQGFPPPARDAARRCAAAVIDLLCPEPIRAAAPSAKSARVASWYVAGLMTTADWIGSGTNWFPYTAPLPGDASLAAYWEIAREAARRAVREAGIVAPAAAPLRPFGEVTRLDGDPTPVQRWAGSVALPESACLVIIEEVTGAGKTEAAQMIVHRLLAAGRVAGAYWAMPTQATANAMYERQANVVGRLFVDAAEPEPSLVLAHGQQRLHGGFRDTVLPGATGSDAGVVGKQGDDDDLPGTVACAAFLADDRRAALLADVGAGTIDQALLGVLPSRFNAVRLFGLADKVLLVDEAHAYDAYMGVELQELLRFQAALGGCAVVLSATLPQAQRALLAKAWLEGLRAGGWSEDSATEEPSSLRSDAYPLATIVAAEGVREVPLETAAWSHRTVGMRFVNGMEDALDHAVSMAAAGAAVAWVRNTVDDCLAAAAALRARGVERVLVFHARFAQGDRQTREGEVLKRFGKRATAAARAGWVLVATQVIEQSLDLDFDAMISDVAPVDLLIQRAGRLWRHNERASARPAVCRRELVVLAPPRDPNPPADWLGGIFAGTAAVYRNAGVLWRTVEVLTEAGSIKTPSGLRALIEGVYSSDDPPPGELQRRTDAAMGEELAAAQQAVFNTLKIRHGYDAGQGAWLAETRIPTRLGDEPTAVRLARIRKDGSLVPWVEAQPAWKAWALSEVRLRTTRVPPDAAPQPQYVAAAVVARRDWGRFEQELPILPLEEVEPGLWRGALIDPKRKDPIVMCYSTGTGLIFGTAG